jgi:hypothetical protein
MSLVLNNELVNLLNLIGKDNKLLNDYFGKSIEVIESDKLVGIQGGGGKSLFINPDEIFEAILVGAGGDGSGGTLDSTSTGGGGGAVVHLKIYKPPSICNVILHPGNNLSLNGSNAHITFFQDFSIDIYATKGDNGNHAGIPSEGGKFIIDLVYYINDPPYFIHSSFPHLEILQKYPSIKIMKAIRGGKGGTWTTPAESVCDVVHLINRDFKFYSQGGDLRGGGASLFGGGGPLNYGGDNYGGGGGAAWNLGTQGGTGVIIYFRYREI